MRRKRDVKIERIVDERRNKIEIIVHDVTLPGLAGTHKPVPLHLKCDLLLTVSEVDAITTPSKTTTSL